MGMTDRERTVPAGSPARGGVTKPGPTTPHAHPEPAPRGDGPPMSLTLAPPRPRPDTPPPDPVRAWLAGLSAGTADLPAFAPAALLPSADRTPAEAEAAARAAGCPDLFVVHAPDPLAGERVIAEVARAAAGRVLVLSPDPAAADRVAERLARAGAAVVRALADDENPARPSAVASRVTSAAVGAGRAEQAKRDAAAAVAAADARLTGLEKAGELAERLAPLDAEAADLLARRDAVEAAVRADPALAAKAAARAAAADRLAADARAADAARAAKAAAAGALRHQSAEAPAEPAKKTGFFARLLGGGKHGPDPAEVEKQAAALETEAAALAARAADLRAAADKERAAAEAEREDAVRAEVAARRAEFEPRLAALAADRDRLRAEMAAAGWAGGDLAAARYAATHDLVLARERAAEVTRSPADLARRALADARVVVGVPRSLGADPVFARDPGADGPPFALLVLDRAEDLAEPDFVGLARLARRWVLVGDAAPAADPRPGLNGSGRVVHPPARGVRPAEPAFASRLARALDREAWAVEGDRLVCRLAHPTPDGRRALTREPLLDRPEVELRFAAGPGGEPDLVEVAFPAGTAVAAAKGLLYGQLGEVVLRPCGPAGWHADGLTACWPAAESGAAAAWVELDPGVREKVVGGFTAAVAFDPAAGWDAARAAAWLDRHAPASAGRFAAVPRGATRHG
ncbi:MAG: hypothetical protein C0501_23075 [Isosphaera sp.]|nr:hypothetical protein [Isosphaera sp.]